MEMFFRITEYTLLTILVWLFALSIYVIRWVYIQPVTQREKRKKKIWGWLLLLTFVLINGYDQHRVIRAQNFDIPAEKLSNIELQYRKKELDRQKSKLDRQKERTDTIKQVDELTNELDLAE